jgi:hypothetical protein
VTAKASIAVRLVNPGRHTRPGRPVELRNLCLTVLIMLVAQYGLGIFLNLYVSVPASDHDAGLAHEIASGPGSLTLHATLGLVLIVTSVVLLVRAIAVRSPVIILLVALALTAILGAFAAGEVFVRGGGSNSASLIMAFLTGVALLCDIGTLVLVAAARPDLALAASPDPDPAARPDFFPAARPDLFPAARPDLFPAAPPDLFPAAPPDLFPAAEPVPTPLRQRAPAQVTRHAATPPLPRRSFRTGGATHASVTQAGGNDRPRR